jgi:uncharacterized protein (TIGR02147 family)
METHLLLQAKSYRDILLIELNKRKANRPLYSLRSFAKKLQIPAPALSEILNGKRGLSRSRAETIAKSLEMNLLEKEYFVALVESTHARSKKLRDLAFTQVRKCQEICDNPLPPDQFAVIADWWHLAILELARTRGFQSCPLWIAQKLGISISQVRDAVGRLLRMKILKKTGDRLKPANDWLMTSGEDIPSKFIRKFHKDLMQKAFDAIESQSVETRNLSSLVFSIDMSDAQTMRELKKIIVQFNRKVNKLGTTRGQQTQLYCFATQLFSLEES